MFILDAIEFIGNCKIKFIPQSRLNNQIATAASLNDDEAKVWLDEHCPQKSDWLVKLRTGESD
jgi:hypothetical protein